MSDSKEWLAMMETDLVFFKCPSCDEMSKLQVIKDFRQTIGCDYILAECDVCHDTVRLRIRTSFKPIQVA